MFMRARMMIERINLTRIFRCERARTFWTAAACHVCFWRWVKLIRLFCTLVSVYNWLLYFARKLERIILIISKKLLSIVKSRMKNWTLKKKEALDYQIIFPFRVILKEALVSKDHLTLRISSWVSSSFTFWSSSFNDSLLLLLRK